MGGERLARLLGAIADCRPHEIRPVVLMFAYSVLLGVTAVFFETAANTVFLSGEGGEGGGHGGGEASDDLPLVYLGATIIITGATALYTRLEHRLSLTMLLTGLQGVLLICLVAFRLALVPEFGLPRDKVAIAGRIFQEVLWMMGELAFWTMAGRLFNLQQGKRLFPLIGSGELLAEFVGGKMVGLMTGLLGSVENLLIICVLAQAGCMLMPVIGLGGRWVPRLLGGAFGSGAQTASVSISMTGSIGMGHGGDEDAAREGRNFGLRDLLGNPYIRLILAMAAVNMGVWYFLDFTFYRAVGRQYDRPEELAVFLGEFYSVAGGVNLVARATLAGWVLTNFGVKAGLMSLPVIVGVGAAAAMAGGVAWGGEVTFWLLVVTKLVEKVLNNSLHEPATRILYQPVPTGQRVKLQAVVEGMVQPLTAGATSLVLLAMIKLLPAGAVAAVSAATGGHGEPAPSGPAHTSPAVVSPADDGKPAAKPAEPAASGQPARPTGETGEPAKSDPVAKSGGPAAATALGPPASGSAEPGPAPETKSAGQPARAGSVSGSPPPDDAHGHAAEDSAAAHSAADGAPRVGNLDLETAVMLGSTLLLLALLALVTIGLAGQYGEALARSLARRSLDTDPLSLTDGSTRRILERRLESGDEMEVIYALNLLSARGGTASADVLVRLLLHPSAGVRLDVLERIEKHKVTAARRAVERLVGEDPSAAVVGAALRAMVSLAETEALDRVAPFLTDPRPEVRKGAMAGLLRDGGIEGVLAAGEHLMRLVRSEDASDRVVAAETLGRVGIRSFYRALLGLLADPDPAVRRAALTASGAVANPALWRGVVAALSVPALRSAAAGALVAGGETSLPALNTALDDPTTGPSERLQILRVLRRIGGPPAAGALLARVSHPDGSVRREALLGLRHLGWAATGEEFPRFVELIRRQTERVAWLMAGLEDLAAPLVPDTGRSSQAAQAAKLNARSFSAFAAAGGAGSLTASDAGAFDIAAAALVRGLEIEVRHCTDEVLLLVGLMYPIPAVRDARTHIEGGSAEKRALAQEILDQTLDRTLKGLVLPLVEDRSRRQTLAKLSEQFPQTRVNHARRLQMLLTEADWLSPWTRACALYEIGLSGLDALRGAVEGVRVGVVPLLSETAGWAADRLMEARRLGTALGKMDARQVLDDGSSDTLHPVGKTAELAARVAEASARLAVLTSTGEAPDHGGERKPGGTAEGAATRVPALLVPATSTPSGKLRVMPATATSPSGKSLLPPPHPTFETSAPATFPARTTAPATTQALPAVPPAPAAASNTPTTTPPVATGPEPTAAPPAPPAPAREGVQRLPTKPVPPAKPHARKPPPKKHETRRNKGKRK